jgi:hypothetical protein
VLVPHSATFLPGSLYLHDLALIDGALMATATGHNAVVELMPTGGFRYVWWPKAVERDGELLATTNHIQLNSIAAGPSIETSLYSATLQEPGPRRPGDPLLEVDGRGVLFDGQSREPSVRGLTRPHSARRWRDGVLVADSGQGRLVFALNGTLETVAVLDGWTRGLTIVADDGVELAFVATSRVIPGFETYAPGVQSEKARCGVHCIDLRSGKVLSGIVWPGGFQIFGLEWLNTSQRALRLPDWPGPGQPPHEHVLDTFSRFVPAVTHSRTARIEATNEEGNR